MLTADGAAVIAAFTVALLIRHVEVLTPFGLSLSKPVLSLPKWPIHLSTSSRRTDFKLHLAGSIAQNCVIPAQAGIQ
jgi:hypothetical protein